MAAVLLIACHRARVAVMSYFTAQLCINRNQKFKVNSAEHCSHHGEKTKNQEKKEKRDMSSV